MSNKRTRYNEFSVREIIHRLLMSRSERVICSGAPENEQVFPETAASLWCLGWWNKGLWGFFSYLLDIYFRILLLMTKYGIFYILLPEESALREYRYKIFNAHCCRRKIEIFS